MNLVGGGLVAAGTLAVAAAATGVSGPPRVRAAFVGLLTALSGAAGALAGAAAAAGQRWHLELPRVLPGFGITLSADALSGWFALLIGGVTAVVGVYTVGYAARPGHGAASRTALTVLPLFTAAMLLVPVAASVPTLLLGWELMAITSLVLVLADHRRGGAVRTAGLWYAAMTQAGFVAILVGLFWLSAATGHASFDGIRAATPQLDRPVAAGVFLLSLAGFAAKAGAVPLHPWLPRAHAEAPSHVSALMSAAMVNLGIYGILRVGFDLLAGGARWWWVVVLTIGALSALYGIIQAAVARDVKRLLAFSTSENIGLILLGIGFAGMLAHSGNRLGAALALTAALLHTVNHAAFKTLLFTAGGAAANATGTRDMDAWGGLIRRMPATTALFGIGAFAAAALPPGNGFISEWLLLQAFLHPGPGAGTMVTVAGPLAVAVVALTAGVAVATFVKAVGTGFLARPRSETAARAHEATASMRVAMSMAALACVVLAVLPVAVVPAIDAVLAQVGLHEAPVGIDPLQLRLSGIAATIQPLALAVGIVGLTVVIALAGRRSGRARRRAIAWDCGDGPLTARMQYTATSFAEPLQRVFDDVLAPETDIDVTHASESAYHPAAIRFQQSIPDRIEHRLYRPMLTALSRLGQAARGLATGSMHRYLAYMLGALIAVLAAGVLR